MLLCNVNNVNIIADIRLILVCICATVIAMTFDLQYLHAIGHYDQASSGQLIAQKLINGLTVIYTSVTILMACSYV